MTAEVARDAVTGRLVWRTHAQWFEPGGRMIGEEWRRFYGDPGSPPRPLHRHPAANRWADRLILACLAGVLLTGLALWGRLW
jgi:hypothetical protein